MTNYIFGPFRLVPGERRLERDGGPVNLTPRAMDLLLALVQNRPRALSRADLIAAVWPGLAVEEGNVAQQVYVLRHALAEFGHFVATVPRHGYRFVAPVVEQPAGGSRLNASPHCLVWDGRAFLLPEGSTLLGRAENVDVQLLLPSVSRRHARIRVKGACATVEDLGSTHGTWRGARRVGDPVPLTSGDEIRMGSAVVVYRFTRPDDTTA